MRSSALHRPVPRMHKTPDLPAEAWRFFARIPGRIVCPKNTIGKKIHKNTRELNTIFYLRRIIQSPE